MSQHEESALKAMKRKYLGEETEEIQPKKKKKTKGRRRFPQRKEKPQQTLPECGEVRKGRGRHKKKKKDLLQNLM